MSAVARVAGSSRTSRHVGDVPILLKKSFGGDEREFLRLLMRFVRSDVRDHIASQKNDDGVSYLRCRALQRRSRLKIDFCEIFGFVRFSTFSTLSANERHSIDRGKIKSATTMAL
jgi:hypothetical protein